MIMKETHFSEHILHFSWDLVAINFWHRYPNPYSKHVLAEEILDRYVTSDGKLYTKRLVLKKMISRIPYFIKMFTSSVNKTYVIEESLVDPASRCIDTVVFNIGKLSKLALITEHTTYKAPSTKTSSLNNQKAADDMTILTSDHNNTSTGVTLVTKTATSLCNQRPQMLARQANHFFISRYCRYLQANLQGFQYILETRAFDKPEPCLSFRSPVAGRFDGELVGARIKQGVLKNLPD